MTTIEAQFVNTKRVPSRGMYQIILEVPIEHQGHVHNVLGWPADDGSARVNITLITEDDIPAFLKSKL